MYIMKDFIIFMYREDYIISINRLYNDGLI